MKKILIVAIVSLMAMVNLQAETSNVEMCKTFIEEAKQYQDTMKNDKLSNATLAFYKDKVVSHCGTIVAKVQYEENFFSKLMVKDTLASVDNCKVSIALAKTYAASDAHNSKVLEAYKENVVDNCGTLVAKKAPAFCLFDLASL